MEIDDDFRPQQQTYQSWSNNGKTYKSPTGQEYFLEPNCKNVENIQNLTIDKLYHELRPVWKSSLQGATNFDPQQM